MFSVNISVNILISFLKHYGVRHLVLSPGSRNIPFVTSVEIDPFFTCHSVVDERNAAFYALGIAQVTRSPVGLASTSGTAVSNYLTGLTEAYNSHAPIVAITCDRSPYVLDQLETQKIDQPAALKSVVRYCADLPVLKDRDDIWHFERLLSEAFIALNDPVPGPVHINMPLVGDTNAMWNEESRREIELSIKYIDRVSRIDDAQWTSKRNLLSKCCRLLVVVGQGLPKNTRLKRALTQFCEKYQCPVLADNLSNVRCPGFISAEAVCKGLNGKTVSGYLPEIVITIGLNFQERIKDLFKAHAGECKHWGVDRIGKIHDCFKSQTVVFESLDEEFFERMISNETVEGSAPYLSEWQMLANAVELPQANFGNLSAVLSLCKALPPDALLHVSILNSMRLSQFVTLPETVHVYGNASSFGIDGCLPTFIGQAAVSDRPSFIIIGDVSFFYAMNALAIKGIGRNVHVFLVNNGGAAEFHIPPASNAVSTIDRHIGVAHSHSAKAWAEDLGFEYIKANDALSLDVGLRQFIRADNERPVLFEVFTDMRTDGEKTLQLYRDLETALRSKGVIQ